MKNLELGTVFRWNNFPDARYGEKNKARWFVCIGFSNRFAQVAEVFLCTTTTQLNSFKDYGNRKGHKHFIFNVDKYKFFNEDCAIDFFEKLYPINQDRLNKYQNDMEIKGRLDSDTQFLFTILFMFQKIFPLLN